MPKLRVGEMSEGVKRISEACDESAGRRIEIMKRLLLGDETAKMFAIRFRTFAELSAWASESDGITPLSPKTLRAYIQANYSGGQKSFLEDAKSVSSSMRSLKSDASPRSKQEKESRANAVLEMTQQYLDLLERFLKLSSGSDLGKRELAKHFRLYGHPPDEVSPTTARAIRRIK